MMDLGANGLVLALSFLFGLFNLLPAFPWAALGPVLPQGLVLTAPLQAATWIGLGLAALLHALPLAAGALAAPFQLLRRRPAPLGGVLVALLLCVAMQAAVLTVPAVLPGLADRVHPVGVALVALAIGLVLLLLDRLTMTVVRPEHLGLGAALLVAALQAGTLLPGASPFLLALLALRLLAAERPGALAVALLVAAPFWIALGAMQARAHGLPDLDFVLAVAGAFMGALVTIGLLAAVLKRHSLTPVLLIVLLAAAAVLALAWT